MGRDNRKGRRIVDGLLLLDKPTGITSNAALQRVKRLFNARKAGHTGSLDPLASGLLPICLGQATKLSAFLLDAEKTYVVTARFGARTDTADADGTVVEQSDITAVSDTQLREALASFRGEIEQVPPMYSALKHGGRRLYELARAGQEVGREPRRVVIHELEIESFDPTSPVLRVRCSKGTYVRTLVEDLARACGTLGHVAALRRTGVGPFTADQLVTLDMIEAASAAGQASLDALLRPIDEAIADWPAVELGAHEAFYLRQGHAVTGAGGGLTGRVRLYGEGHRFLGVGEALGDGRVAPRRLLVNVGGSAG
ncbi:MAG: tRNA pseudouridine(55) synthase TruB [Chromatiales bacterium]|nr:MAG: tRNA pseudouridine(55) synthase TruB [Chromatiales bacterium]